MLHFFIARSRRISERFLTFIATPDLKKKTNGAAYKNAQTYLCRSQTFVILWKYSNDFFFFNKFCCCFRLPGVSDCSAGQTARVTSNLHPTSTMAVSRVPSPPPQEVNTPVAENWCYTQVSIPNVS